MLSPKPLVCVMPRMTDTPFDTAMALGKQELARRLVEAEQMLEARQAASIDAVLAELMDRRLLNDVDDDLHHEIAVAIINAAREGS